MALYIVIRLFQNLLNGQASLGTRLEDCRAGLWAEGRAQCACAGAVGESALAAGCCSLCCAGIGTGSFTEDEELDENEEDQGERELAKEESRCETSRGGRSAILLLRVCEEGQPGIIILEGGQGQDGLL